MFSDESSLKDIEETEKAWLLVINFLALEIFGEEIHKKWGQSKDWTGHNIQSGEVPFGEELYGFEKRLWLLLTEAGTFIEQNKRRMINLDVEAKFQACVGLGSLFWAIVEMNHPDYDLSDGMQLGIRSHFQMVKSKLPENPYGRMLGGLIPVSLKPPEEE